MHGMGGGVFQDCPSYRKRIPVSCGVRLKSSHWYRRIYIAGHKSDVGVVGGGVWSGGVGGWGYKLGFCDGSAI